MDLKDKHIMVIDDDDDDRQLFCRALGQVSTKIGCLRVSSGKAAWEYLSNSENTVPDVIFLDINMPVMTGWEFLTKIKRNEKVKSIPVIMFSTSSNKRDIDIAFDLGAESYCVKPDEPEDLQNILYLIAQNIGNNFKSFLKSGFASKYFHIPTTI
ncbi:MAG: rcp1 3 [Bacteroidota bacterium]|jgi:CheY-like chemotaxis protein|nr:rcp1 3 [Bacteroidota bacterium]